MIGIYIRVSTLEQAKEGYSISAQKEKLKSYCSSQGWEDYKYFIDEGISAKDTKRPELKKLLNEVKDGNISTILVYRLDRFTRSVSDLYEMLKEIDQNQCTFKSATEPYDTSTAMGRMFITIVAALAQWETENLSERVKMALEEKVSTGERVGNVPYGFTLNSEEKLEKNEQGPVLLDMIERVKSGKSFKNTAEFLNKTNTDRAKWTATAVIRVLTNPALYGATRWNDKVYENTHEGYIAKEDYVKLQQIIKDRSQHRRRDVKSNYVFQGVLICPECGKRLSVNRYVRKSRTDGSEYQSSIYRCQPCASKGVFNRSLGESRLLEALYNYMKNVIIDPEDEEPTEENKQSLLNDQLKKIESKREKYQRAWASDLMSDAEFKKLMDETREVYEELKGKAEKEKTETKIDKTAIHEIVTAFNQSFGILPNDKKAEFVSRFIRSIEFDLVPQPPKDRRSKEGKDKIVIRKIVFM